MVAASHGFRPKRKGERHERYTFISFFFGLLSGFWARPGVLGHIPDQVSSHETCDASGSFLPFPFLPLRMCHGSSSHSTLCSHHPPIAPPIRGSDSKRPEHGCRVLCRCPCFPVPLLLALEDGPSRRQHVVKTFFKGWQSPAAASSSSPKV